MISDCAFVRLNNGLRLAYVEQGSREGPTLILLHGYSDSHRSFDLVRPLLPRAWRVIALTQRGHGLSDKPAAGYDLSDFADDVCQFMAALNIERAIVVGHSMGAAVALQAAAAFPDRVSGLALIGAFADFQGNPGVIELAETVEAMSDPVDGEFVLTFQESTVARMIPQRFLDAVVAESMRCPARAWCGAMRGFLAFDPIDVAKRTQAPATLIWGEQDAFVPREDQVALRNALCSARLHALKGAGHAPHWDYPERVASLIGAFVTEIDEADILRDSVFG
jgi:non-heme chloroperoxidase